MQLLSDEVISDVFAYMWDSLHETDDLLYRIAEQYLLEPDVISDVYGNHPQDFDQAVLKVLDNRQLEARSELIAVMARTATGYANEQLRKADPSVIATYRRRAA